jgi:hypothetical protein
VFCLLVQKVKDGDEIQLETATKDMVLEATMIGLMNVVACWCLRRA